MVELLRYVLQKVTYRTLDRGLTTKFSKIHLILCRLGGKKYLTKGIPSPSRRDTPTATIIRVRPQKITHRAFMWHFLNTIKTSYVIKGFNRWRQPTVQTKYFGFNLEFTFIVCHFFSNFFQEGKVVNHQGRAKEMINKKYSCYHENLREKFNFWVGAERIINS